MPITASKFSVGLGGRHMPTGSCPRATQALSNACRCETRPDNTTTGQYTSYTLDDLGNRTLEELKEANGTLQSKTEFEYEGGCQVTAVKRFPTDTGQPRITEYAYDCNGNLEKVWDANHSGQTDASQHYQYDQLNRLETLTQPEGGTHQTQYEYDVQDHLTKVTDAEGNVTDYIYSDRDLLTQQDTHGVSGATDYRYNKHGALVKETDARDIEINYTVDALDRVRLVNYPNDNPPDTTYSYDKDPDVPGVLHLVGRLAQIDRGSHTIEYRYDRFGRMTQDGKLGYGYDGRGNRTTIAYPGNITATYTYDEANRQTSLVVDVNGVPQTVVSTASFRPSGPLAGLTFGNAGGTSLTETRDFDLRYYPTGIELALGMSTKLDWNYTELDEVGNVIRIDDQLGGIDDRSYSYDPLHYFLECAAGPWSPGSECANPPTGNPYLWTYDKIGNRESQTDPAGKVYDYTYETNTAGGHSSVLQSILQTPPGGNPFVYDFDAAGHLIAVVRDANDFDFTYDDAGRLVQAVREQGINIVEFGYDGRSFLTAADDVGGVPLTPEGDVIFEDDFESGELSAWGGGVGTGPDLSPLYTSEGQLVGFLRSGVLEEVVLYFAGRPVALYRPDYLNNPWVFLTTDHLGTPIYAADINGAKIWEGGFEPFGGDYAGARDFGIFLRLPGQWFDPIWEGATMGVDLYYNVHRWYEYGTGRYTRVDPLGLEGGPHTYTYAAGQPLLFADPVGLEVFQVCCRPLSPTSFWRAFNIYSATQGGTQGQHCFVRKAKAPKGSTVRTWSLVRSSSGKAQPGFDHKGDRDYQPQSNECGPPACDDPDTERCLNQAVASYPVRPYPSRLGGVHLLTGVGARSTSAPNSNSFAQVLSQCGVTAPSWVGETTTPGWTYWSGGKH